MVALLRLAGGRQGPVVVEDGLGEAGGAGGEVDGGVVRLLQGHRRRAGGAEAHQFQAVLRIGGRIPAHKEHHPHLGQLVLNGVYPAHKLRPEDQDLHVRQLQTVLDLLAGVPEIQGHGDAPRLEDAEVHRQPLQTVHHQNTHLGPPLHAPAEQQVGKAVGPAVKVPPAQGPAIGGVRLGALNEAGLPPGDGPVPLLGGVDLHQRRLRPVEPGVAFQKLRNDHVVPPKRCCAEEGRDASWPM